MTAYTVISHNRKKMDCFLLLRVFYHLFLPMNNSMDKFSHKTLLHKTVTFKEIQEKDFMFAILHTV